MKIYQNQYINKSRFTSAKENLTSPFEFEHVSDISNGYIQSKNFSLFNGVSDDMYCGGNSTFEYAYFLLSNPIKSKINIYVKNSIITNHSHSPLIIKIYYCVEDIVGKIESSNFFCISNSNSSGTIPQGKIFFGNELDKIYGVYGQNLIVPSYNSYNLNENGSIVISSGFSYLFEVIPINSDITSNFVMSFSWWEESISSYF